MVDESPRPVLWLRHINPIDGPRLATQMISHEEVTGLIETTLPGAQAVNNKREQLTVDGGV